MDMCYDGTLVMPSNCVVMDEEEMTYVEGGAYYSGKDCRQICAALVGSGAAMILAAGTAAIASKIFKYASVIGGVLGKVISAVVGLAIAGLCKIAYGLGYGAVSGRGVNISACPWPWESFVLVETL